MYESERKGGESVANGKYDHIIHMTHHVSEKHPRLDVSSYAAQFSPFAALTGYDAAIVETARPTDDKRELSEEQKQIISKQLYDLQNCIKTAPYITVVFFEKDRRKTGGTYRTVTGTVKKMDEYSRTLEMAEGLSIPFEDILSLDE